MNTRTKILNILTGRLDLANPCVPLPFDPQRMDVKTIWKMIERHEVTRTIDSMRVQLDKLVYEGHMTKRTEMVGEPPRRTAFYGMVRSPAAPVPVPAQQDSVEAPEVDIRQYLGTIRDALLNHNIVKAHFNEDGSVEYEQRITKTFTITL